MKRWIVLAVLVVALTSVATVTVQYLPASSGSAATPLIPVANSPSKDAARSGAVPKAVVDGDPVFDFGTKAQQDTGKHAWVVHNEGKADLDLWMISSTCSCTLAKFKNGEKATVKPGETTEIVLEYETRANNGDYEKGAVIGTNDPLLPKFPLHVKGKVYPAVVTYPPGNSVTFSNISNDVDDHMAYVAILSKDRPETQVLKATSSKPEQVLVSYAPMTEEECRELKTPKGVKVSINVKGGLPLGAFREEVVLATDHPKQPEVRLTVAGTMSGPVNLLPGRLILHQVDGKAGGKGEIFVSVRGGRETKLEVASTPSPLQAEITPLEGGARKGRYRLTVTIPPGTPSARVEDEIVIKTDHPKADRVIVPVSVWIH